MVSWGAPDATSQILIMSSNLDAEASSFPSREKLTVETDDVCPSIVCTAAFQEFCVLGNLNSHFDKYRLNLFLMTLVAGAKRIAEEYSCNGVKWSVSQLYKINRFASSKKFSSMKLLLDLIKKAIEKISMNTSLSQQVSSALQSYWYFLLLFQWG